MKLSDFDATKQVSPWPGGGKIPWHEPGFSKRMLLEHLSQEHDRAIRRLETIDKHVSWINNHVLGATAARVLDLGCGPGFYTARLARLGHTSESTSRQRRSRTRGPRLSGKLLPVNTA